MKEIRNTADIEALIKDCHFYKDEMYDFVLSEPGSGHKVTFYDSTKRNQVVATIERDKSDFAIREIISALISFGDENILRDKIDQSGLGSDYCTTLKRYIDTMPTLLLDTMQLIRHEMNCAKHTNGYCS